MKPFCHINIFEVFKTCKSKIESQVHVAIVAMLGHLQEHNTKTDKKRANFDTSMKTWKGR